MAVDLKRTQFFDLYHPLTYVVVPRVHNSTQVCYGLLVVHNEHLFIVPYQVKTNYCRLGSKRAQRRWSSGSFMTFGVKCLDLIVSIELQA